MSSSVFRLAHLAIRRRSAARRSGGITLPDLEPGAGAEEAITEALRDARSPTVTVLTPTTTRPAHVPDTHSVRQAAPQGASFGEVDTHTEAAAIPSSVSLTQRVAIARDIDRGTVVPLQLDLFNGVSARFGSEVAIRAVNVAIAAVLLVLLSPIFLLIMLAVKLTSPGPIFYTQVRVGLDRRRYRSSTPVDRRQTDLCGRTFMMYKIRTMHVDAESGTGPVWAREDDPRVTSVGRVLRACRLDELPQLYNVLKGDMNIVGPRPERPTIVVDLVNAITEYPIRQRTLPGITGLAQITQAPDGTVDDVRVKVRYDLEYLRRRSVLEDLRIMARTPAVMFLRRTGR